MPNVLVAEAEKFAIVLGGALRFDGSRYEIVGLRKRVAMMPPLERRARFSTQVPCGKW